MFLDIIVPTKLSWHKRQKNTLLHNWDKKLSLLLIYQIYRNLDIGSKIFPKGMGSHTDEQTYIKIFTKIIRALTG